MTEKELFTMHTRNYMLCYNEHCEKREQCLRWILKDYVPHNQLMVSAINPRYTSGNTAMCRNFRNSEKRLMGIGMIRFYDEIPHKVELGIRKFLISHFGNTMYYNYRRGDLPITPGVQEEIREICIRHGWDKVPMYDAYREEYEW